MEWILMIEQQPTEHDLPFITYGQNIKIADDVHFSNYETWNDVDWFVELIEEERLEWKWWASIKFPEKL